MDILAETRPLQLGILGDRVICAERDVAPGRSEVERRRKPGNQQESVRSCTGDTKDKKLASCLSKQTG